jgi:excisionase family DNA binding protein
MANDAERYLTPPMIAKQLRVSPEKVLNWIRKGDLRAINVSDGNCRPRYRVAPEDLDEFLKRREVQPPPPIQRRRRKRQPPEGGPIDPDLGKKLAKTGQARLVCGKYYRVWEGMTLFF